MTHPTSRLIGIVLAASFGASAQAAIFTVGTPSGPGQPCTHGTIQSAINAAETSPGADTIRLTRTLTYEPEANAINTSQELTIEGGYATCTQASADTTKTVVSGAGGVHAPVFTITAPSGGLIHLRNLTISGGDVDGAGQGGGIRFSGNGVLEIQDSDITNNLAGYGGGIYAAGTDTAAELVIGSNVIISNNTARYDGGGVYAEGLEMSMVAPGNGSIMNNRAQGLSGDTGYGGGLYVTAQVLSGYAYIGSGAPVFGAIYGNHARYGGGVAVGGQSVNSRSKQAQLQLFTTRADVPAIIQNNDASVAGGAIHLRSGNSGDITASARLWNASLVGNSAPDGAAVMVTGSQSGSFSVNGSVLQRDDAIPCAVGAHCGRIEDNFTNDIASGAVIRSTINGDIALGGWFVLGSTVPRRGVLIRNNSGQNLIKASGSGTVGLGDALIASNQTSGSLVDRSNGEFALIDSTLAGNTIGASSVLSTSSCAVRLQNSILWQPGKTTISRSGGTVNTWYMDVSEAGSLGNPADPTATTANPRFVDPAHGDYGLRAGSPLVDYAELDEYYTSVVDALGQPRNRDLPVKTKTWGVRDIGAFERQSLQPLALNNDFDIDLRLWDVVTAGSTTRDTTQNASGAANSGSAHVSATNMSTGADRLGVSQCIHLPGPAIYALNGWGRGTGTQVTAGDRASLFWEYRRNGGEGCTGAPDSSGTLTLSGGAWSRPAEPARIEVTQSSWGASPSIKVTLVATEFGPGTATTNAWFDGITLDAIPFNDVIFKNGFD